MMEVQFSKDALDQKVRNYRSLTYIESTSENNFVYRMFELSLLFKNRGKVNFVLDMMGVDCFNFFPKVDEIESLVRYGNELIKDAQGLYEREKENIDYQKGMLVNLGNGKGDSRSSLSVKEQFYNQKIELSQAENRLKKADDNLTCCKGLLGMIRPMVEHMLNKDKVKLPVGILNKIPDELLPSSMYCEGAETQRAYIYKYSWKEVTDVIKAIDSIYHVCNPSADVHTMNSGWKFRYKHCREYFKKDNHQLRQSTTHSEYADTMTAIEMYEESKLKFLSK